MAYKIISKYSNELSIAEWLEIKDSFNTVFEKDFDLNYFENKYQLNPLGFSCHGILYCDNLIVGSFTVIPRKYIFFGESKIIGLGCDAYILKKHRINEFFLKEMSDSVVSRMSEFNVDTFISLPNPNAYKYWKILGKWKDIGVLDYYIYPVNMSKLILGKSFLKHFSFFVSYIASFFFRLVYCKSKKTSKSNISIEVDDQVKSERFCLDSYEYLSLGNSNWACYRIYEEDNVKVAYIIYVTEQSKKYISKAIFKLISQSGLKIDMILYIGNLKNKPINLYKVPKSKEPRRMKFIGFSSVSDNLEFLNLDNWDLSLISFDNR